MSLLNEFEKPLDIIKSAFAKMCEAPASFAIRLPPLPVGPANRVMNLADIVAVISDRAADPLLRSLVWGQVLRKARRAEPGWMIAAAGLAHGKLVHKSILLSSNFGGDSSEDQADLIEAFLVAVRDIDLADPRISDPGAACAWRAYAAVRTARRREMATAPACEELVEEGAPSAAPPGHREDLLARAVNAGVLTVREAEVLARSYIEDLPADEIAAWAGVGKRMVFHVRRQAARKLVAALRAGILQPSSG